MELGTKIGRALEPGSVIILSGELGSGKTVLTKGLARGLGVENPDLVTSPSFVIMNIYPARCPIYHIDLYRVSAGREVEDMGLDEYLDGDGVAVVEWGENLPPALLPEKLVRIKFTIQGEEMRRIDMTASEGIFPSDWQNLTEKLK